MRATGQDRKKKNIVLFQGHVVSLNGTIDLWVESSGKKLFDLKLFVQSFSEMSSELYYKVINYFLWNFMVLDNFMYESLCSAGGAR